LSDDTSQAQVWLQAFASLCEPRGRLSSHSLAKQIYWQTGDDVQLDSSYHLLSPLYASSLAHRVFETLQEDRFSEAAKAARDARKGNTFSERPVHDYPQMAVQQLGGTKPQNISQLNSERRGNNCLLASLPPMWRSAEVRPLYNTDSMFHRYNRRPEVRQCVKTLLQFLKTNPTSNEATRNKRAGLVNLLIDEFLQFSAELRNLKPGWSQMAECKLSDAECRWLDEAGVATTDAALGHSPPIDLPERISFSFANWLNAQLRDPLPMGDPEFLAWRNAMLEEIKTQEREGIYAE
jgi:CRISPR-associated protein Csy1